MLELQNYYIEGLSAQIAALEKARRFLDDETPESRGRILRIAHVLKGSGGTFGYPAISAAALEVERAADGELPGSVDRLLSTLRAVAASGAGRQVDILIVEDNASDVELIRAALAGPSRRIHVAGTTVEARRVLERHPVRLVVLDLVLPDLDGRNFLVQLREESANASLPVFVVSARVTSEVQAECLALGAEQFFRKPVDPDVLSAAAGATIRRAGQASRQSLRDALTGLPNRAAFHEALERARSLMGRTGQQLSLAMIDLDRFKAINDGHGHALGDEVLRRFARVVESVSRRSDVFARWGGEEFAALFPGTSVPRATVALNKVREAFARERFPGEGGEEFSVTFSAGVTGIEEHTADAEALAEADRLLYLAKTTGRNRVINPQMDLGLPVREILLAEDDPDVAFIIGANLEREGFRVLHCADGELALEQARDRDLALAILDVMLPGLDGFALLSKLRDLPSFAKTPVVMLTGLGAEEHVVRGFELGADDYMVKPFSPMELQARVHRLLQRE